MRPVIPESFVCSLSVEDVNDDRVGLAFEDFAYETVGGLGHAWQSIER